VPLVAVDLVVEKLEHQLEKTKGRLVGRSHPRRRPANSVSVLREKVRTA
jgi:ribosome-associated translation inhibitor RaiA